MLLPEKASVKKDEAVTLTYQWGHPFEHQLFDAPAPEKLTVLAPDGKATDLTKSLEKTTVPAAEGKKVTAYQLKFTPEQRGDYVFLLQTRPIWMEEEEEFFQDTVKVVLHVQAQKGWDGGAYRRVGADATDAALRPATGHGLPGEGGLAGNPMRLPLGGRSSRSSVTTPRRQRSCRPTSTSRRAVKTDPGGVATCTLTEAGWWAITAIHDGGELEREGKKYPVKGRQTFWVFVDEKR